MAGVWVADKANLHIFKSKVCYGEVSQKLLVRQSACLIVGQEIGAHDESTVFRTRYLDHRPSGVRGLGMRILQG